jgi:alpha-beta hydrolase superfamily lysophospholipase
LVLHLPEIEARCPCVVACHGLFASKDTDKYFLLAEAFTRGDLALARFDFQGCGESTGVEAETTVATRIADTRAVLAHLGAHPRLDGRFGFLGSSMGGFVALHVVSSFGDSWPVVTWNAPADLRDVPPPADSAALGAPFFEELRAGRYAKAPSAVTRHLVIQSDRDEVVPAAHGAALHARAREPRGLVVLEGGDHRLTDSTHRARAVAESLRWFRSAWAVSTTCRRPPRTE